MRRLAVLIVLLAAAAWSAREVGILPFSIALPVTSPHVAYRHSLERSGLSTTPLGKQWVKAGDDALSAPLTVSLPARRSLSVAAEAPSAWAFRVSLKRGQRMEIVASISDDAVPAQAFVDLFAAGDGGVPEHARGAIGSGALEADADRDVIVRVQPELLRGGMLDVTLRAVPALAFPVAGVNPRALQSIFGDPRDAGRRQHEGVDIFARRGANVLSASDGLVIRVAETGRGGRVVWVWDMSRSLRLYYAHLDTQLVSTGQRVKVGDVIGTVGNTGNARTTPPHLHFGIYEHGRGAIDPYWFVAPPRATAVAAQR